MADGTHDALEFYTELAFDKYEECSAAVTVWLAGHGDLFEHGQLRDRAREWGGIWQACERELAARRVGR